MRQVVLEHTFDARVSSRDLIDMMRAGASEFEKHQVEWLGSLLAADGTRMVSRFGAEDTDSIRQALHALHMDLSALWEATEHQVADPPKTNVIVERSFAEPAVLDELQAQEDAHQWCLDTYNVRFARTFFSIDRKRMLCLYEAPDAEAVRAAQLQASMPLDRVWAYRRVDLPDAAR